MSLLHQFAELFSKGLNARLEREKEALHGAAIRGDTIVAARTAGKIDAYKDAMDAANEAIKAIHSPPTQERK